MTGVTRLLFVTALILSAIAAYYSIVGLAAIFSSAFWAVVIMASVLEISKLVTASWLYHNWSHVNVAIRGYLTGAVVVLMMITSLGIFGFLSRAHVDQGLQNTSVTLQLEQLDREIGQRREQVTSLQNQLTQLDRSINIQLDANRAQGALNARRQQETERARIRERLDTENQKILALSEQKTTLRQQESVLASEVGPIRYVAEFFSNGEANVEKAVRWMIVALVLVFDPLAVLMLIAANMSLSKNGENDQINVVVDTHLINQSMQAMLDEKFHQLQMPMSGVSAEEIKNIVEQVVRDQAPPHPAPESDGTLSREDIKECVDQVLGTWLNAQLDLADIKKLVAQTVRDAVAHTQPPTPQPNPPPSFHNTV